MAFAKLRITPRKIQIALGFLWLLDGALQVQPKMFTSAFASQVIAPAAQGQPPFVSGPMNFGMHLFLAHPVAFNTLLALTQLVLGALILFKRTTRTGLYLSVLWAAIVWSIGEGYGGLFSGRATLIMGLPGAALLYGLLALAVIPKQETKNRKQIAYWLAVVWLIVWVVGGSYQILPKQGNSAAVGSMIAANADGAPGWMASIDNHVGNWLESMGPHNVKEASHRVSTANMQISPTTTETNDPGYLLIIAFWLVSLGIGFGVLKRGIVRNVSVVSGMAFSLLFWVVGQDMGAYFTGTATDLNSGPLLILLGLAILGCSELNQGLTELNQRVESFLIGKPGTETVTEFIEP